MNGLYLTTRPILTGASVIDYRPCFESQYIGIVINNLFNILIKGKNARHGYSGNEYKSFKQQYKNLIEKTIRSAMLNKLRLAVFSLKLLQML